MIAVGVVEVAVHQVVHVITVGHGLVPAAGTVLVAGVVGAARVIGGALGRIRCADGQAVLVHVIRVRMVEMTVVQVVGMAFVPHGDVAAAVPVDVIVAVVAVAGHA